MEQIISAFKILFNEVVNKLDFTTKSTKYPVLKFNTNKYTIYDIDFSKFGYKTNVKGSIYGYIYINHDYDTFILYLDESIQTLESINQEIIQSRIDFRDNQIKSILED